MNRPALNVGVEGSETIDRKSDHVNQAAEHFFAYRHLNRTACLPDYGAAAKTRGIFHRYAANRMPVEVLLHLDHKLSTTIGFYEECIIYRRQAFRWKFDVNNRTANSSNGSSRFLKTGH